MEFEQNVVSLAKHNAKVVNFTEREASFHCFCVKTAKIGFKWMCFCKNLDETGLKLRIIC